MIAVIKYNAGNVTSVCNAISRLGYVTSVTDDPEEILKAEHVIFPGVGEAGTAMAYLKHRNLDKCIRHIKVPFLGICLGLQLMCQHSEEGNTACIGIFDSNVRKFPADNIVPHMGWNNFSSCGGELLKGINQDTDMYYVHNYYAEICPQTVASCNYILPFSTCMNKNNFYATQFHPEKSADAGLRLLKNFLEL